MLDVSYFLANLLCVFIPLLGLEIWGNLNDKQSRTASSHSAQLVFTLFLSATLCTFFNFRLSEEIQLNLSIVSLTVAFFVLSWQKGLLTLGLYTFFQLVWGVVRYSDGSPILQVVAKVFSLFRDGLLIVTLYAIIMCVCSLLTKRYAFLYKAAAFVVGLLLFTLVNYSYQELVAQMPAFSFLTFVGYIIAFNLTFVVAARLIVADGEKRQAANELMQREEVYRRLVEDSPDAIAISIEQQWVFVNKSLVQLFGADNKEQLLSTPSYQFMNQSEQGEPRETTERVLIKLNGDSFHAEMISLPTHYHGEPAVHTIIRDVTKRKEDQSLLVQAEKLRIAGQLAAGIAHEIRNPLTAVKGFLKLLKTHNKEQYLTIISEEINRIEDIITELLMLAKPNKAQVQEADITQTIKQIVTLLEPQAILQNITFEADYGADRSHILCDENQLKQAFINFLKNAFEAMPQGGTVKIQTKNTGDKIHIEIIDEGEGIPADKLHELGMPFFTTKDTGTGLGFMVSKKIIEDHNGKLAVSSIEGQGTKIRVSFPISHMLESTDAS